MQMPRVMIQAICSASISATLDFLEYLFIHSGIRYLLVIGAYRENEVSQGHPLTRAFDTIRAGDVRVQEIVLASGADDT
jgi:predicted ATPase